MSRLDKYRKSFERSKSDDARALQKRHRHIATEAARRLASIVGLDVEGNLKRSPGAADFHAAKMQAVAVLGLAVRPGDLPPDAMVMESYDRQADGSEPEPSAESEPVPIPPSQVPAGPTYADRFEYYLSLLRPLERVKQNPRTHPEGDALYHSLQVFENVRRENLYDEELLTAALLHDVGKAIDIFADRHTASLKALQGRITDRTARLIEKLSAAHAHRAGTLGHRAKRALDHDEDFEAIMLLADADHHGRKPGAEVPSVEEAIAYIRELAENEPE